MKLAMSRTAPSEPIYVVEVIDTDGFAWLYARLHLHEALRISAFFAGEAKPGKEPRVFIPPELLGVGLTNE
jgi:hypothetical protein